MKQKLKDILKRYLPVVLVALLLGISVYNLNAKLLMKNQLPMPFGIGGSVVLTGSMEPELSPNDLIIVKKTDSFYERQIVVYQDGNSLTVHRIDSISGDEIITKGDANNTTDDPITKEMIKGEVVFAIPFVGIIIDFLKNPIVTLVILGLAVWLMERSFKKEKNTEQNELEALKNEIRELTDELKK